MSLVFKNMGLGSEIQVPEITYFGFRISDPGVKKAPGRIPDLDPQKNYPQPEKKISGSRIQGSKRLRITDPGSGSATLLGMIPLLVIPLGWRTGS